MTAVSPLCVFAGEEALSHIRNNGLKPDDISILLGGSSGPKWLVLQGIDQFLINEFFKGRSKKLHLLGTSAGAWRMACYALEGLSAHNRLTEAYLEQCYSSKPSGEEVLGTCRSIIKSLLGNEGSQQILKHPFASMNLITTQCHGLTRMNNKPAKMAGFGFASLMNRVSRKSLGMQFTRVVMHHPDEQFPSGELKDLPTRYAPLTSEKIEDAILSTGTIPILIKGVENVAGAGVYQDGGVTDYGFDLPLTPSDGFVLYPHFTKFPAPGWFDKSWLNKNKIIRKPNPNNYSKTIMLVPSDEFVQRLPYGKIPDRHDFLNFTDQERIKYWRETVALTRELAEDMSSMNWSKRVQPLPW